MRILVIEDDKKVAGFLKKGLKEESHTVDVCIDGEEGCEYAESEDYDIIILDVMLPKKDGLQVCRELRQKSVLTPIIMLTARDAVEDKVIGLQDGADDYLTKPFSFQELLARIQSLQRRSHDYITKTNSLKVKDLELNLVSHKVTRAGKKITLTGKEYALLEYLMRNKGRIITQSMIIDKVWDMNLETASNVVSVFINHLREKIDKGFDIKLIHTVRGMGYQIDEI
jgi:DNA-binding response OmpR family regulator